jgi:putative peptidoglycan lipid II flippase
MAYTVGLIPFVLIRSVVAPFLARGDTLTPMKAALIGTAVNIAFKVALMGALAQVGLALATSIGAWINFVVVLYLAARHGFIASDARLRLSLIKLAAAGAVLALVLWFADPLIVSLTASLSRFRNVADLIVLVLLGGAVYGGLVLALFGRQWLTAMRNRAQPVSAAKLEVLEGSSPPTVPD